MVSDKMVDRNYLPFQSAREHRDRGMMKWLGFFLSEHTSSLANDKKQARFEYQSDPGRKADPDRPALCQSIDGEFLVRTGKTKISYWGQVTELNPIEITIKTSERYQLLKLEDILEIKASGG